MNGRANVKAPVFLQSLGTSASLLFVGVFLLSLIAPSQSCAQYNPFTLDPPSYGFRAGRTEVYVLGQYWNADEAVIESVTVPAAGGPNPPFLTGDIHFEFEDAAVFGFGIAYHLNNYFALNAEFGFGYPDYTATFGAARLEGDAFMSSGNFNIDYYVLPGPLTPFVSGGLGYVFIDSGIPEGPPGYYGWWDYWWDTYSNDSSYSKTYFTLNAAAGVRWDINDALYARLSGGANWIVLDNGAGWLSTLQITAAVGWKF